MASKTDLQDSHFHVLAVDDSLLDRKLLEKLLTVSSYQVTCVESGNKALEFLGLLDGMEPPSEQPDAKVNLIITDYCMPGMTGYDLLKKLKESSWKDIPVVIMSSENSPSRINRCLEGGAEEFLLKPVQLSDMKRLQPHILKSQNSNDVSNFTNSSNSSNENNNANKRKAMSPQPSPSERRPRFRGLTAV